MVEALVRRIEAMLQAVTLDPASIVLRIAVLEPVRQDEVDDLLVRRTRAQFGLGRAFLRSERR